MNWHYVEQGTQIGPVSDHQLAELNRAGKINADTLVWREGMTDWLPFHQIRLELPDTPPPLNPLVAKAPLPTDAQGNPTEAVCAECGGIFPIQETIRHGKSYICAGCKPVFMQKLSEGAPLNTGEMNYAGFGIRFGAKFLDGLIIGVPAMIIYFIVMIPYFRQQIQNHAAGTPATPQVFPILFQLGFVVIHVAYQTFFLGKYGATPGKMVAKLQVVTAEGGRIGYGRAMGRAFAEILSGLICYIGYFMVLFDSQKRALHDHICSTRVIQK
jgi:uncharacterized RDD family membrane protein YckC